MNLFSIMAKISLEDNDYNNKMKQASDSGDNLGKSSEGLGKKLMSVKGILVGVATGAIGVFIKNSIMAASEVEEMSSKFTAVFGDMETEADAWAKSFSDSIGRNKNDIKSMIANQSDLMMGFGMTGESALDLSKKMTALAFDLGSFNNVADDEAVLKLQKSIMGLETSGALESLGVDLTETTMKTSEFTLATGKSWDQLSRTEKMQVRYQEAMKQSERAIGDAERTAGGFANSLKALGSKSKEFMQTIGAFFLPLATTVVNGLKDMVSGVIDFTNNISEAITLFIEGIKAGEDPIDNLWYVVQEVFGINIPDSVLNMVDSVIGYFQTLWDIAVDIWNSYGVPLFNMMVELWQVVSDNSGVIFEAISTYFGIMTDLIKTIYNTIFKPIFDLMMDLINIVKDYLTQNFGEMGNKFNEFVQGVKSIWESNLKPCFEAIGNFIQNVLAPAFKFVFENIILPVVSSVFSGIGNLWNNSLKPIFTGIIDFITGVFSGNWSKAWGGIVDALGGIWSGITTVIKAPLNAVIALINKAIGSMNNLGVTIPDWVPIWGGKEYKPNFKTISYLEEGGILTQPTMLTAGVMAGEKNKGRNGQAEAVIPLDELVNWIKDLASRPVDVSVDGRELARAISPYKEEIDEYDNRYSFA